jgi:hypothetical protein
MQQTGRRKVVRPASGLLLLAGLCWGLSGGMSPVLAHDGYIETTFGDWTPQTFVHEDAYEWKGYVFLTLMNSGIEAWGDLHLQITDPYNYGIANVDWVVDPPYQPTSSQSPLSWVVDNSAYGAKLDLFFYSDPVGPGELATFIVRTDNTTDQVPFFGVCVYPTPVPEPSALLIVGLGGLLLRRRRS